MYRRGPLSVALLAILAAGCGGNNLKYETARVSGRVTLNGEPLPMATVRFMPIEDPDAGISSAAKTDDQGNYSLYTLMGDRGACVGTNRVSISTAEYDVDEEALVTDDSESEQPATVMERVPAPYRGPTSTLTFKVPAEGTDQANFELTGTTKTGGEYR